MFTILNCLALNLNLNNIVWLLYFILSNNYFMHKDSIYKKVHGCAMGSPVSPIVANFCMEEIDSTAIA